MSLFKFALFRKGDYIVRFLNVDGTPLKEQYVSRGANATAPADPVFQFFVFTGWDKAFTNITSDLVVTATFKPVLIWNLIAQEAHSVTFDRTATPNVDECLTSAEITTWINANRNPNTFGGTGYAENTIARVLHNYVIDPFDPVDCTTYYFKAEAVTQVDPFFFVFQETRLSGGELRSQDFTIAETVNIYTTISTDLIITGDPLERNGSVEYQIGAGSWTAVPIGNTIALTATNVIRFRITSLTTDTKFAKLTVQIGEATGHLVGVWDTIIEYTEEVRYTFNIDTLTATSDIWTSTVQTVPTNSTLYISYTESQNLFSTCEYKKNADAWVAISSSTKNATISVVATDTLQFRFEREPTLEVDCNLYIRFTNASGFLVGSWFASLGETFKLKFGFSHVTQSNPLANKKYYTNTKIIPTDCTITFYGNDVDNEVIVDSTVYKMNVAATIAGVWRNTRTIEFLGGEVIQLVFDGAFSLTFPRQYYIIGIFPDSSNIKGIHITYTLTGLLDKGTLANLV